jgi:hypothetical protein
MAAPAVTARPATKDAISLFIPMLLTDSAGHQIAPLQERSR